MNELNDLKLKEIESIKKMATFYAAQWESAVIFIEKSYHL